MVPTRAAVVGVKLCRLVFITACRPPPVRGRGKRGLFATGKCGDPGLQLQPVDLGEARPPVLRVDGHRAPAAFVANRAGSAKLAVPRSATTSHWVV